MDSLRPADTGVGALHRHVEGRSGDGCDAPGQRAPRVGISAATLLRLPGRVLDPGRDRRTHILHDIASGEPLIDVLESIAGSTRSSTSSAVAILLIEDHGRSLSPLAVANGIEAAEASRIGGSSVSGCCGLAIERGTQAQATDLAGDVRSCLAIPVRDSAKVQRCGGSLPENSGPLR